MNVITNRPILDGEEATNEGYSYARGQRTRRTKSARTGEFQKKAKEFGQRGYTRLKEAGAFPVIENLLGLTPSQTVIETPKGNEIIMTDDGKPQKSTTTRKVLIVVGIAGAIGLIWYFGFRKNAPKK